MNPKKIQKEKLLTKIGITFFKLPYKNLVDAKITFSKPHSNVKGSNIKVHIKTPINNKKVHIIAEMSLKDFADGITGMAEIPCELLIE